ncbi:putative phosphatidylinositol 4-kinase [Gregarina niphandrodes]|uniref:Phosphatidylinositol 4-kinase n=1 Tax=Gregarina niphandrodes TaxID=110365 RepID=A0A023AYE8_GRENI|nr:putative phosphatidylinositol 4-kinase [Gregarina niphandrodes]EZG43674.1 putative phosphatidylinositol 4-kinase [Gregarina niphandrodes]|eukprot:XP_011133081.1 putative phosphatidylinositol 4-kinase [Gregarina niphandrodes]
MEFVQHLVKLGGSAVSVEVGKRPKYICREIGQLCKELGVPVYGVGGSEEELEEEEDMQEDEDIFADVATPANLPWSPQSLALGRSRLLIGTLGPEPTERGPLFLNESGALLKEEELNALGVRQITTFEAMLRSKILTECQSKADPIPRQTLPPALVPVPAATTNRAYDACDGRRATHSLLSPTNGAQIIGVKLDQVHCLKSATRVPYTVQFDTVPNCPDASDTRRRQNVILKYNDDIRHDMLVHQVATFMNSVFARTGLPLRLITYKCIPYVLLTPNLSGSLGAAGGAVSANNLSAGSSGAQRTSTTKQSAVSCCQGGVIEMLENCKSRHEIGTRYSLTLDGYYSKFYSGQSLEQARWNFTTSLAAASLLTFLLQIKDRHNANILLTHDGFLVHIDFGFILDFAPAHDLKFERAPFKLTNEMIGLIDGGSQGSSGSLLLRQLIVHGYLALRVHREELVLLVESYKHAHLKGFKPHTINRLKERLQYDKSDREATEYILRQTRAAVNALTTKLYDVFQAVQQGIAF